MHQAVADNDIFGQTTVISRTICRCIKFLRVTKLRCWKLKLINKILSTEGHAAHIKTNVTWYNSPRCCFIPFIGWKFDASMHTSVRCIGEINRWIKQRSQSDPTRGWIQAVSNSAMTISLTDYIMQYSCQLLPSSPRIGRTISLFVRDNKILLSTADGTNELESHRPRAVIWCLLRCICPDIRC